MFFAFSGTMIIGTSCEKEKKCPYKELSFNSQVSTNNEKKGLNFNIDLSGELNNYFKKIGKGTINAKTSIELDNISQKMSTSEIKYDEEFVQRWNALVHDLCGQLSLFESNSFSSNSKDVLEQSIINKVTFFYESVTTAPTTNNENIKLDSIESIKKDREPIRTVSASKIEVSIQLKSKHNGAKSILVNDKEASILPSSTRNNPRISLISSMDKNQKITIITNSGDTCIVNGIFHEGMDAPIRFIPEC